MSKDKIIPTPLVTDEIGDEIAITFLDGDTAIASCYSDPMDNETRAHAYAIVSAVNATYGNSIDPVAVPELVRTLKNMCDYFDWLIKDPNFPAYREAKSAIEKAKLKP